MERKLLVKIDGDILANSKYERDAFFFYEDGTMRFEDSMNERSTDGLWWPSPCGNGINMKVSHQPNITYCYDEFTSSVDERLQKAIFDAYLRDVAEKSLLM